MKFLTPAALWLLLLIPLMAIPYFFVKRKYRSLVVPNLFLFDEAFEQSPSALRNFGWRRIVSFLIVALIALSLIVAVAHPVPKRARFLPTILIVDTSASMNALDSSGTTRFDKAIRYLNKRVAQKAEGQEMMILASDGKPEIICGFTKNGVTLRERVKKISPTERVGHLAETWKLARLFQRSRKDARIEIVTDGCEKGAALGKWTDESKNIQWVIIGSTADNIAITRFESRRKRTGSNEYELLLEAANFSKKDASFDVEIDLNGVLIDRIPFHLKGGEMSRQTARYASESGGILHGEIVDQKMIKDALSSDNRARSVLLPRPTLDILFYGEEEPFLFHVLDSQPNVKRTRIEKIPESLPENTLLVVYRDVPSTLPKGNILIVNPQNNTKLFQVAEQIDTPILEAVDTPMTRSVRFENLSFESIRRVVPTDGAAMEVFVQTPETPVLFSVRASGDSRSEWVVFNFATRGGTFPLRVAFPILFANAVERFRAPGDDRMDTSDGLAANLESGAESNLDRPRDKSESFSDEGDGSFVTRWPMWSILAAMTLFLFLLEWHFYQRRVTE